MSNILTLAKYVKDSAIIWQKTGISTRVKVLQEIGINLEKNVENIHQCFLSEGLSLNLAKDYTQSLLQASDPKLLEKYSYNLTQWVETNTGGELLIRKADGVVLVFAQAGSPTFNAAPLASILLPGNGVIVVRAPVNDKGIRYIIQEIYQPILHKHGFAKELVSLVTNTYREALVDLSNSQEVSTLISIGTLADNNFVASQANKAGKKVILEHYGRGCMVLWKDADVEKASKSASRAFDFSSRPCFLPKHFLVHENIYDKFLEEFILHTSGYTTIEADKINGTLIPIGRTEPFLALINQATQLGKIVYGGHQVDAQGKKDPTGNYFAPTIITLDAKQCFEEKIKLVDEEIFFPIVPVIKFSGKDTDILEKMVQIIERKPVGLRTSIWTKDLEVMQYFSREINHVGLLKFNIDHSISPSYASFWGSDKGDNHLFWERTSHIQAIDCHHLSKQEIESIFNTLGVTEKK
jgi:acyl-CoA reductase-like NAD-dependent aldehyde dehydrogenase